MFCNRSIKTSLAQLCLAMGAGAFACMGTAFAANSAHDTGSSSSQPSLTKAQREGKRLAFTRSKGNCLACHAIDGGDMAGTVGPKLANVKQLVPKRGTLFKHIWDETQFNPQTAMPPFGRNMILSKDEINKIVDYLYTQ